MLTGFCRRVAIASAVTKEPLLVAYASAPCFVDQHSRLASIPGLIHRDIFPNPGYLFLPWNLESSDPKRSLSRILNSSADLYG